MSKYHLELDIDFQPNTYGGLYIALEGIDGSGKTAQIKKLTQYFKSVGKEVIVTREPRKKEGLIKTITNDILQGNIEVPRNAYQYLFTADRIIQFHDLILPSLKAGKVVLTDRCFWSSVPYGMWERGGKSVNEAQVILLAQGLLAMQHGCLVPDLTFYLSVDLQTALKRVPQKIGEREEIYEKEEILEKVLEGYAWLLEEFPQQFEVINAKQSIAQVSKDIIERIKNKEL